MVNWRSSEVEALCAHIFGCFVNILLGIYMWYFCLTLGEVEVLLVCRRLKFSIALIPYLVGRYSAAIVSLILVYMFLGPTPSNCLPPIMAFPVLTSLTVICSSTNILLRPLALWKSVKPVAFVLILLALGQVALGMASFIGPFLKMRRMDFLPQCHGAPPIGRKSTPTVVAFYLYTVIYDSIILALTIFGLWRKDPARNSPLWIMLHVQGVGYLVGTMIVYLPTLVFGLLDLNGIMDIFFASPGGIISIMVSSAAVTSLYNMKEPDHSRLGSSTSKPWSPRFTPEVKSNSTGNVLTTHLDPHHTVSNDHTHFA